MYKHHINFLIILKYLNGAYFNGISIQVRVLTTDLLFWGIQKLEYKSSIFK